MPYFLAMDAGGTKTEYVLADETRLLARVQSETIKLMRTPVEKATANLDGAFRELESLSGVSLRNITSTCVGTAGNTVPLVTDWLRFELGRRVGGDLLLLGDVEIALDAAFPGEPGILVLAGTGSNAAGRTREGLIFGAGGYGPVLSDQGSGHRIGSQALRAVFIAIDEQRHTELLDAILQFWKLRDTDELISYANTCPASQFSGLARVVLNCAESGDPLAKEVLEEQGKELAYLALLLHRHLLKVDGALWKPKVAFAGSILQHVHPLREALLKTLFAEIPDLYTRPGVVDAIEGALWRARQALLAAK
jgi:N-acetylglucosamine kinase-like BadF-type ATPase